MLMQINNGLGHLRLNFKRSITGDMAMPTRWPALNQVLRRQELMDRMMERLGVDALTAVSLDKGQTFVEARAACRYCQQESACRAWLDAPKAPTSPPEFCPNARFFLRCGLFGSFGLGRERRFPD